MPFINEPISPSDFAAQGFDELDQRFPVGAVHSEEWTIDRETGAFLRLLAVGRDDFASRSDWLLCTNGQRFILRTDLSAYSGARGEHGVARYVLTHVDGYPADLLSPDVRDDVLRTLSEALTAYADDGLHSTSASFEAHVEIAGGAT